MRKIAISQATDEQVRAFCETTLQLELVGVSTRQQLEAVMGTAWPNDYILADDPFGGEDHEQIEVAVPVPQKVFDTGRDDGPTVMVKILETNMPGGAHPAAPNVNGLTLVIQRGILVGIPYAFYAALQNAVVGSVHQGPDKDGKPGELITTNVTNYPMSEVQLPPRAEIDAWIARNGSRLLAA